MYNIMFCVVIYHRTRSEWVFTLLMSHISRSDKMYSRVWFLARFIRTAKRWKKQLILNIEHVWKVHDNLTHQACSKVNILLKKQHDLCDMPNLGRASDILTQYTVQVDVMRALNQLINTTGKTLLVLLLVKLSLVSASKVFSNKISRLFLSYKSYESEILHRVLCQSFLKPPIKNFPHALWC